MANEILVTRGLTKRYGNHLAVDHVELSIQKGQIYGLVGRNGAGKTTIIRMVTAQTVPTEGQTILVMYSKRNLEFHHLNIEMQN